MDWIRLTKSGRDLTGLRGRLIEVTEEELRKHNKRNDCWTCIRGNTNYIMLRDLNVPGTCIMTDVTSCHKIK